MTGSENISGSDLTAPDCTPIVGHMTTTEIRSRQISKPGFIRIAATCCRCGGTGIYSQFHGVCYRCGGNGRDPNGDRVYAYPVDWTDEQVAAHVAQRRARSQAAADRKEARKNAERDAWLTANPQIAALWQSLRDGESFNEFVSDILRGITHGRIPTERQVEAILRSIARDAERVEAEAVAAANAEPLPTGTVTVEGEVLTVRSQESRFGSTLKMLVAGNGWKVWGTMPSSLMGEGVKGKTVRFVATVEASDDDASFGFFKRPRNAEIISDPA